MFSRVRASVYWLKTDKIHTSTFLYRCNSLSRPTWQLAPRGWRYLGVSCPPPWVSSTWGGKKPQLGYLASPSPTFQNILSIESFFVFPYGKTYYFYDIHIIIIHVHYGKQTPLNAWFLGMGVKIPWSLKKHTYLVKKQFLNITTLFSPSK